MDEKVFGGRLSCHKTTKNQLYLVEGVVPCVFLGMGVYKIYPSFVRHIALEVVSVRGKLFFLYLCLNIFILCSEQVPFGEDPKCERTVNCLDKVDYLEDN